MSEALRDIHNWGTEKPTGLQKEGLKLWEKVKKTEKAFGKAMTILANLDREENKTLLCRLLNKVKGDRGAQINSQDIEGCELITVDREELKKEFGVTFFPITLAVPIEKWEQFYFLNTDTGEKFDRIPPGAIYDYYDKESEYYPPPLKPPFESKSGAGLRGKLYGFTGWTGSVPGGFFIPGLDALPQKSFLRNFLQKPESDRYFLQYPFNLTGIAFYTDFLLKKRDIGKHEDLHRIYRLYSPFSSFADNIIQEAETNHTISPELILKAYENALLNEINAYRESVKIGEMKWYDMENKKNPDTVCGTLLGDLYSKKSEKIEENKLLQACQTMEYIQNYLSEPVITHILLHCEGFDDLIAWSRVKPEELNGLNNMKSE